MLKVVVKKEIPDSAKAELSLYPELTQHLLYHRKIDTKEKAINFLNPKYEDNFDPFLMKDMDKAVHRILDAIEHEEKIVIFSDYDADGIPGAVILHDFFKKINYHNFANYIPHRVLDGFGLNEDSINEFFDIGAKLIITVDCGITDIKEVEKANHFGMDVIITDHHLPKEELPKAFAILDPKLRESKYTGTDLCGAGVAFKLVQGLIRESSGLFKIVDGWEKWLLDMVGIATISDMVSLTGENRIFASYGMKVLRKTPRPGIMQLLNLLKINQQYLTEDDLSFMITPRINAASRMGEPEDAFLLLSTKDDGEATAMAIHLDNINTERKTLVATMVKEIKKKIASHTDNGKKKVLVVGNPDWKPSLLGLVATSLLEDHNGPVFLWGREQGTCLKGSCRSDGKVDIFELMKEAKDMFDEFGGHSMSGGFSLSLDKVDLISDALEKAYDKLANKTEENIETEADKRLSLDDVNEASYSQIDKMAPFGVDNPKPLFLFEKVEVESVKIFGKTKNHLELTFKNKKGQKISAIGFFCLPDTWGREIKAKDKIDMVANIEKSFFKNRPEIRLRIVDITC
jgi:single-stranded-DNA-specific exonuclease